MARVEIKPELIQWARERAGLAFDALVTHFPKLQAWETGQTKPTLKQLEKYAKATMAPLGYFFLPVPPDEPLPLPDFRTPRNASARSHPSPNLLDTVYAMQRRQAWLRDDRIDHGIEPVPFVGSTTVEAAPQTVAAAMRVALGVGTAWAAEHRTWTEALHALRSSIEMAGIMVVANGVVGNNTHRKLDPGEFRGFVLADRYAPLIFINGADGKAAQMFTLAHELAHLWVGQDAVFNLAYLEPAEALVERFCNRVAAEFLIPEQEMRAAWAEDGDSPDPYDAIARRFKVSGLVAARRALDLGLISRDAFALFYEGYLEAQRRAATDVGGGGDFYSNQGVRVGRVFAAAVHRAVLEGRLPYREAFELTGLHGATFDKYMRKA